MNERLLAREPSRATLRLRATEKPLERGTSLVSFSSGPAASTTALAVTIPTLSTTGDPGGHDDGPHHNGSIGVASTAGLLGTIADEAGTPMVEYIGTPNASAVALGVSTTSTTTGDPVGHNDRTHHNGSIEVASTAGSPGTPMVEYTPTMVEFIGTLAASAAALATTISTTLTTGDDGHNDGPHNKGFINVASTARSSGTFADEAGTFMVSCMTGLAASAASKISTTTTAAGAPSLDNGPCVNRDIDVTSTAGSTCTFVDAVCCMTGPSVSAATLASQATIHNTYGVDNADNNRRWTLVPPEFARDSAGPAGVTRHFATVGDDGAGPAGDTQQFATAGDDNGTLYTTIAEKTDNNGSNDVLPTAFAGVGMDTQHQATAGDDDCLLASAAPTQQSTTTFNEFLHQQAVCRQHRINERAAAAAAYHQRLQNERAAAAASYEQANEARLPHQRRQNERAAAAASYERANRARLQRLCDKEDKEAICTTNNMYEAWIWEFDNAASAAWAHMTAHEQEATW